MEKGRGFPPNIRLDAAAPPCHDSPSTGNQLPPAAERAPQPTAQPASQLDPKAAPEPVFKEYPQPAPHHHVQPAPLPEYQVSYQYSSQLPQVVQPVHQVVMVQQMPTDCPGEMFCLFCRKTVVTKIQHKQGLFSWIICGSLGIIGCWPCCLIPLFVKACQDVEHSCPMCNNVLHIYKRM